jgi:hypothetical protein
VRTKNEFALPSESSADGYQATLQIPRRDPSNAKPVRFIHTDEVVGVAREFPESTKAVREGDLETVSLLRMQFFNLNSEVKILPKTLPHLPRSCSHHPGGRARSIGASAVPSPAE